jgi:RNA-directed DNA polymerase
MKKEPSEQTKPYTIPYEIVEDAFVKVRRRQGASGVDGQTINDFAKSRDRNLYKIWNRMSSGSYFPPAVKTVVIPKGDGVSTRTLGIPTVADRIAQMVVVMQLEPLVEPKFHQDSYGYRPNRSAHAALTAARQRCFWHSWVVDIDIKGFFDNLDHELLMEAVRKHTDCPWVLLYIERWLKAPIMQPDGTVDQRAKGTPQGGVISPLLANIYLHEVFDEWMKQNFQLVPFERYADDIVVHCKSEAQAKLVLERIRKRLSTYGLDLHPVKTRLVFCKNDHRPGEYPTKEFDFLGYTFRLRKCCTKDGRTFGGFEPAMSRKAMKQVSATIRGWKLPRKTDLSLSEVAKFCNPSVRGWINYYGLFRKEVVAVVVFRFNQALVKWARRKYRLNKKQAWNWYRRVRQHQPDLFAHWSLLRSWA